MAQCSPAYLQNEEKDDQYLALKKIMVVVLLVLGYKVL